MVSAVSGSHSYSGTYTIPAALAASIHSYSCGATTVVEHSTTLRQITSGTNTYAIQFYWTAPSGTTDSVSFYSLLNAVNGNGASSGDYPNAAPRVTIYPSVNTAVPAINAEATTISIYPNPAKNQLNIVCKEKIINISLINLQGQTVYSASGNSENLIINTADLLAGTYFVRINNHLSAKFLKN